MERDNRGELFKIFTIYERLDKLDEGVSEYLHSVIRQFMVQYKLLEKSPPVCKAKNSLPELQRFFQEQFIPDAIVMIEGEIKIGLTSGRIVDVLGPEHRFIISRLLLNEFLAKYQELINGYLQREFATDAKSFQLEMVALIVKNTRQLFFDRITPLL